MVSNKLRELGTRSSKLVSTLLAVGTSLIVKDGIAPINATMYYQKLDTHNRDVYIKICSII